MRYMNWFAGLTLGLGMVMTAAAGDRGFDRRDLRQDYKQIERLRVEIAHDRARMNEDIRRGRHSAVEQDARELARDQRALDMLLRDTGHDRRDSRDDNGRGFNNSYGNGYNNSYNNGYSNSYSRNR